ncbi:MAG: transketolase C-terminal domain-containing protein [Candidatus Peregrinibacteria bacterium]|nr:transketolase C-terminal domain-containing protein [Candidatus Peregrinibacteria bacterium]
MRNEFTAELLEHAKKDPNILLLTADLGFSVFEEFAAACPDQYLNTGCAEANTLTMAAGLALSGKKVFVYSIIPFVTMRCFEQVRVDVCMHNADVTIVGVGGGLAYGQLGPTHHSIEDISIMRSIPNMKVICPGDPIESRLATRALIQEGGPAYVRLNKKNEPIFTESDVLFQIGKALTTRDGADLTLISTGGMLPVAMEVAGQLAEQKLETRVLSMHTVKPLDIEAIDKAIAETSNLFTLEEHSLIGGLGSAVAEYISEHPREAQPQTFHRFGINDRFTKTSGDQEHLRGLHGLNSDQITDAILGKMK